MHYGASVSEVADCTAATSHSSRATLIVQASKRSYLMLYDFYETCRDTTYLIVCAGRKSQHKLYAARMRYAYARV